MRTGAKSHMTTGTNVSFSWIVKTTVKIVKTRLSGAVSLTWPVTFTSCGDFR